MTALVVVYATTDNEPATGELIVPGFLDDGLSWRVRSHLPDGRTRWIGLGLQPMQITTANLRDSDD